MTKVLSVNSLRSVTLFWTNQNNYHIPHTNDIIPIPRLSKLIKKTCRNARNVDNRIILALQDLLVAFPPNIITFILHTIFKCKKSTTFRNMRFCLLIRSLSDRSGFGETLQMWRRSVTGCKSWLLVGCEFVPYIIFLVYIQYRKGPNKPTKFF